MAIRVQSSAPVMKLENQQPRFSHGTTSLQSYAASTCFRCKGKGKAKHLYSALHGIQTTLKHSGMDHTVLSVNTMPAFTF